MSEDNVKIKAASIRLAERTDDWFKDRLVLSLSTEDKVDIKFDLDPMAGVLLALTLQPALELLKERAGAQGGAK